MLFASSVEMERACCHWYWDFVPPMCATSSQKHGRGSESAKEVATCRHCEQRQTIKLRFNSKHHQRRVLCPSKGLQGTCKEHLSWILFESIEPTGQAKSRCFQRWADTQRGPEGVCQMQWKVCLRQQPQQNWANIFLCGWIGLLVFNLLNSSRFWRTWKNINCSLLARIVSAFTPLIFFWLWNVWWVWLAVRIQSKRDTRAGWGGLHVSRRDQMRFYEVLRDFVLVFCILNHWCPRLNGKGTIATNSDSSTSFMKCTRGVNESNSENTQGADCRDW